MDKAQALIKIGDSIKEVERLRQLPRKNQEYPLWKDKVKDILGAAFGKHSEEYERFTRAVRSQRYVGEEEEYQQEYREHLTTYETALKSIIQKNETLGTPPVLPKEQAEETPKAFIAHGCTSGALDKLEKFLCAMGVEPLVVEEQASKAKSVDDKVEYYMSLADCAIILATGDDKIDGKLYPRQNVAHEIGLAQKTFRDKIIYLKEEGAEFPSNISPKVWEPFTQQSMDRAFIAVAREMKAFGLIQATPPSQKATNV